MGTKHRHYDVIVAWAAGEEIEWRYAPKEDWEDLTVEHPVFDERFEFRIKPKRVKKEGWVNVYPDKYEGHTTEFHFNKDRADRLATAARVACIRIEWEETVE